MHPYRIHSSAENYTETLGHNLGMCMSIGDTVLLSGELGAGKTCLARGIAKGAECKVGARSPTFIIVAEYPGRVRIFHCDLYRISSGIELEELALDENLSRGALVIEWPENGEGFLPQDALTVRIKVDPSDNSRHLEFYASGNSSDRLLSNFMESIKQDE